MTARRRRRWLTLDGSVRRLDGGRVLLGGSPMRLLRLTEAGARLVDRIEAGQAVPEGPLVDRLLDAGAVHPRPLARRIFDDSASEGARPNPGEGGSGDTSAQVSVVVPVFVPSGGPGGEPRGEPGVGSRGGAGTDRFGDPIAPLVGALAATPGVARVIVVDDASPRPVFVPEPAESVRRLHNGGPGPARQTGLELVDTPLVAFVDADVELPDGWLEPLLAHFADPAVVAVAPRIVGRSGPGRLARFDAARSPLDLGPAPAPVRPRTRVSYVPTAVLVARADAVRAAGGFDSALRTGEDVDLVWRLAAAGGRIRYEPEVVVTHAVRPTLGAWARQRHGYGRSAAPLARRHPGQLTPVAVSGWSAASWVLAAAGWPAAGAAVALGSTLALPRKLAALAHPVAESFRIAGRGHLWAGRQLASAVTRVWWPIALAAAVLSPRARRAALAALVVPALLDHRAARPDLDPLTWVALRALDDAAYGSGVWRGVFEHRTIGPLVPDLSNWPGRRSHPGAHDDDRGEAQPPTPAPAPAAAPDPTATPADASDA